MFYEHMLACMSWYFDSTVDEDSTILGCFQPPSTLLCLLIGFIFCISTEQLGSIQKHIITFGSSISTFHKFHL